MVPFLVLIVKSLEFQKAAKRFYILILLLRNVVIAFDLQDSFVMSNLLFIFMFIFLNICLDCLWC